MGCKDEKGGLPFKLHSSIKSEKNIEWKSFDIKTKIEADTFIEGRIESVYSLLEPTYDPYQGTQSLPEICLRESLPKRRNGGDMAQIFLYSSNQRGVGICDDISSLLKTNYLVMFCEKEEKIYVVKLFYDQKDPWFRDYIAECKS